MAGDKIEVNYEELQRSAKIFQAESGDIQNLHNRLRSQVENLHGGGWIGKGADAFYREMEEVVLPAIKRLHDGLQMGAVWTGKISEAFQQAEDEASGLFKQG
ncbi:MAG: WXG100 family type VII secretion target [Anaerolineaceae bacterium]|nr:WXG100 family type VII secretion target [Anaerolineaceae bacterium]